MNYYYDIYLNFFEYPVNYYEWQSTDDIERIMKIPIYCVSDIKDYILYEADIIIEHDKFIISDGVNSLALEVIDNHIAYLSSMAYDDELNINDIAHNMSISKLVVTFKEKRNIPLELREESKIKKEFLTSIDTFDPELLRYIYYDITNKSTKDINKIKDYLRKDIHNHFNDHYIDLYKKLCK